MDREFERRLQEKLDELKESGRPEPIRSDGAGALDLGPRNVERDMQNPDIIVPPATDFGLIPNLRFSMADAHMTIKTGGWSREVTQRELPVDSTLAIVDMNLSPGVREMHSHLQSEWGFVLQGGARDVLSANFGCSEKEFDVIPEKEVYIVDGGDPGPIES